VETLRRFILDRMDERDRRYGERFDAQEKAVAAALAAAEKAVTKAEIATEKRLEGLNELRQLANDQAANFMPKTESEIRLAALGKEIDDLRTSRDVGMGRQKGIELSMSTLIAVVTTVALVVGVVGAVIAHFAGA
jgi:hypothetical protein